MSINKYTEIEEQMRSKLGENLVPEPWNTPDDGLFFAALDQIDAGKDSFTELERQMQSKLDENLKPEPWNIPDDGLFLAALDEIDAKKEKEVQPQALYLTGIFFFTLLLLFIGKSYFGTNDYFSVNQVVNQEKNVELQSNQLNEGQVVAHGNEVLSNDVIVVNDEMKNNQELNIPSTTTAASVINNSVVNDNRVATNNTIAKTEVAVQNEKTSFNNRNTTIVPTTNANAVSIDNNSNEFTETNAAGVAGVATAVERDLAESTDIEISSIVERENFENSILNNESFAFLDEKEVNFPTVALENTGNKVSNFGVVASTGLAFNSFAMPNSNSSKINSISQWNAGAFAQVGFQQNITERFRLSYNIGFTSISSSSRYFDDLKYDVNSEITNINGEKAFLCNIDVESPTTRSNLDLELVMNHEMSHNDDIRVITDVVQNYSVVNVGVSPQYDFIKKNRIVIGAGASVNANYITSFNQDLDLKFYHDSFIMEQVALQDNNAQGLNRFYVSAGINTYVDYKWTKNFSTGLSAGYGTSLNSLSQGNNTYLRSLNIGINGVYKF